MARISYVGKEQAPKEVADIFSRMEAHGAPVGNLWKIAAHSPSTLPHLIRMGNAILTKTKLAPKLREMAILRTAEVLSCEYERRAHTMFGKEVGMTDEQVRAIKEFENSAAFTEVERAVLRFADEVAQKGRVKQQTFSALAKYLDEGMMVELVETVGFYGMIGRLALAFEVDLSEAPFTSSTQVTGLRRE